MTPHQQADTLSARKKVVLRARPNLIVTPRLQGGRTSYVVKDPVSLRYYHLEEPQHFILERMDGRHTLADIQKEFEETYRPLRLTAAELEALASQLLQSGLVETEAAGVGRHLFQRSQEQKRKERWAQLVNVFYFKFPLLDPNRLLTRLLPVGRAIFHPLAVVAVLLLLLAALALVVTRWDEFLGRLPTYREFFSWSNVLYLWLALGLVKILHELGHGLCCKVMGGDVHELGVAFLFFFPTLYCNVTDCWALPRKHQRMAVSAAGIYVELFLAGLATFLWWATDPATLLHNLSFGLILVCSVHTLLFNANPLMRFDGYFVLSDWVEIPNLAQRAAHQLKTLWLRWLGIEVRKDVLPGANRPLFLILYALASLIYRWVVLAGVLWLMYVFLKEQHLAWLGFSLIVLSLVGALALPVHRLVATLRARGGLPEMKPLRLWCTVGLGVVVVVSVCFVPLPMNVRGIALVQVEPSAQRRLVVPQPGGFLDQVFVQDGQRVQQGDVLAVLKNPDLEVKLRLNEADRSLRWEQLQTVAAQHAATAPVVAPAGQTYDEIARELAALAGQYATLKEQWDRRELRAPCAGVVMGLQSWENQGKWLKEGTELCVIGDDEALRAIVLVEPADRTLVVPGGPAWFMSHGGQTWPGRVTEAAQVDVESIPPQLSSRVGGDVVTQRDPVARQEKPCKQQFLVSIRLPNADRRLQPGTLGEVRIQAEPRTVLWRLQRFLNTTFDRGL